MDLILIIAKWMLVIEVLVTIAFVLCVYSIKMYQVITSSDRGKLFEQIKLQLAERINSGQGLTQSDKKLLFKEVLVTIDIAKYFDDNVRLKSQWEPIKNDIINSVMLPQMRKFYKSRKVYKRYYAAHLFCYYFNPDDVPKVIKLICDSVLMISIEASRLGFKSASEELINASIDVFSKYRRLQQSVFSTIADGCHGKVEAIIFQRITSEENPYIKAFCYKLLLQFPATEDYSEALEKDLNTDVLELRIAALNYVAHNKFTHQFLPKFLEDSQWQMRSAAAKLIGMVKDKSCIEELGKALKDPEWWVRIRAAQSLRELGPQGVKILKDQSPSIDKYAYEAAMQVLMNENKKVAE